MLLKLDIGKDPIALLPEADEQYNSLKGPSIFWDSFTYYASKIVDTLENGQTTLANASTFNDAVENEVIKINPILKVKTIKQTEQSKVKRIELTPFKTEEINQILEVATNQDKNLIAVLFICFRISENSSYLSGFALYRTTSFPESFNSSVEIEISESKGFFLFITN